MKDVYKLVVDGSVVMSAEKIIYLKSYFYLLKAQQKNVWIEKDGKKVWFNGKGKKE